MPRGTRSQGRPGTPVIPVIWDSHRPVVEKTFGANIAMRRPGGTQTGPFDKTLGYAPITPYAAHFTGPSRMQVLPRADQKDLVAGMEVDVVGYQVAVAVDAAIAPPDDSTIVGCVVLVNAVDRNGDASLVGRELIVRSLARGSTVWERHLICTDKLNEGE